MRRACDLWNDGEKALAHIHLTCANLAPCDTDVALRLFVADELIEAGVTPQALMKAQGLDPAPLNLLKANFNQAPPRWPAGSEPISIGEWSGGSANFTPVAFLPAENIRPHMARQGHVAHRRQNPKARIHSQTFCRRNGQPIDPGCETIRGETAVAPFNKVKIAPSGTSKRNSRVTHVCDNRRKAPEAGARSIHRRNTLPNPAFDGNGTTIRTEQDERCCA
jgi:hypothetical protein